jgi:nitrogenase molybdenum-iron protein alpha/beta subunit
LNTCATRTIGMACAAICRTASDDVMLEIT